MEFILGKTAGFCYGVKRAVDGIKAELAGKERINCLGEIVHNKSVVNSLEKEGVTFLGNVDEVMKNEKVIIRAHGIPKSTYKKLEQKDAIIKDFTCPNVLKIHNIAETYSNQNYFILLIGMKRHPESIGTISFCGKNSEILQEKEEIENVVEKINKTNLQNILVIAQTTYNSKKFDEIINILQNKLSNKNIKIKKTICGATEVRQKETAELSKKVDAMIIIGDKKSSNTNKLYEISKINCENVFFVQNISELDLEKIRNFEKIGIMAGASTPKEDIDEIIKAINEKV